MVILSQRVIGIFFWALAIRASRGFPSRWVGVSSARDTDVKSEPGSLVYQGHTPAPRPAPHGYREEMARAAPLRGEGGDG